MNGMPEKAEMFFKRALTVDIKNFGDMNEMVVQDLDNIILFYYMQNRLKEAEVFSEKTIKTKEEVYGAHSMANAPPHYMLANIYASEGKYRQAEETYKKLLEILEENLGPDHPDLVQALREYAELQSARKMYTEAADLYERAISILEKSGNASDSRLGDLYKGIAKVYEKNGDKESAEKYTGKIVTQFSTVPAAQ
jgi:tetratricopeptide (TPR) repeat protein